MAKFVQRGHGKNMQMRYEINIVCSKTSVFGAPVFLPLNEDKSSILFLGIYIDYQWAYIKIIVRL
jgi:hypothetical protein